MAIYAVTRASTALSTTNDLMTLISPANRRIRIRCIQLGGLATTSAANVVQVARSSGGTTGGGAITPVPFAVENAASASTVNTTWSAQPTLGVVLDRLPVNANGGVIVKRYPPGGEPELRNGEQLSLRSETGTSNVSLTIEFEEL